MIGINRNALFSLVLLAVFFAFTLWTANVKARPTCESAPFLKANGAMPNEKLNSQNTRKETTAEYNGNRLNSRLDPDVIRGCERR